MSKYSLDFDKLVTVLKNSIQVFITEKLNVYGCCLHQQLLWQLQTNYKPVVYVIYKHI